MIAINSMLKKVKFVLRLVLLILMLIPIQLQIRNSVIVKLITVKIYLLAVSLTWDTMLLKNSARAKAMLVLVI